MDSEGQEEPNDGHSCFRMNTTIEDSVTTLDGSDMWESITLAPNENKANGIHVAFCMAAFKA